MSLDRLSVPGLVITKHIFEPDGVAQSEMEIAVVGAHMSDFLIYQLMANGARFLRSDRTNNDYKLYCLSIISRHVPGLLKSRAVRRLN